MRNKKHLVRKPLDTTLTQSEQERFARLAMMVREYLDSTHKDFKLIMAKYAKKI